MGWKPMVRATFLYHGFPTRASDSRTTADHRFPILQSQNPTRPASPNRNRTRRDLVTESSHRAYRSMRRRDGHRPLAAGVARGDLVVNPLIRLLHPVLELRVRLPAEDLLDQRVVAVPAIDALGCIQVVAALQLDPGD